jgi:hypothetical protein
MRVTYEIIKNRSRRIIGVIIPGTIRVNEAALERFISELQVAKASLPPAADEPGRSHA